MATARMSVQKSMSATRKSVASWFQRGNSRPGLGFEQVSFDDVADKEEDGPFEDTEVVVELSRTESGLGLHFDINCTVTKLLPGCAAEQHGGVRVGDVLLAVDGVEVQPGDHIRDRSHQLVLPQVQVAYSSRRVKRGADGATQHVAGQHRHCERARQGGHVAAEVVVVQQQRLEAAEVAEAVGQRAREASPRLRASIAG